jgi:hypothetical protein
MIKILKEKQIRDLTKKHPAWNKVFLTWLDQDNELDVNNLKNSFSTLLKYKHLISNDININFAKSLIDHKDSTSLSVVEKFSDKIQETLHLKQKENFITSLQTSSYIHLFNNDVKTEIHTILDNKISIAALKKQFFSKLARFDDADDLLINLQEFRAKNVVWNIDHYLDKIKNDNLNVNIVENKDQTLMLEVVDYEACKALGSQAWCIVEDDYVFESYIEDLNRQFIYLDFNLPIEDRESMIGITVEHDGIIEDSYFKDDSHAVLFAKEKFSFNKLNNSEIRSCLELKSNHDAFETICKLDIIDLYDEYANKDDINFRSIAAKASNSQQTLWPTGRKTFLRLLEEDKADPSSHLKLRFLALSDNIEPFCELVANGADPSLHQNYILNWAARNCKTNLVKYLTTLDIVKNTGMLDNSVLSALRAGEDEIALFLLDNLDINPFENGNELIKSAAACGCLAVLQRLLDDDRSNAGDDESVLLRQAALRRQYGAMEILLKDPNTNPTVHDNKALRFVSQRGHIPTLKLLLKDPRVLASAKNTLISKMIHNYNGEEEDRKIVIDTLSKAGFRSRKFQSTAKP